MEAGRLRHRVALQSPLNHQDSNGDMILTWVTEATVWAAIEPMSSREQIEAQSMQSQVSGRIVIRYRTVQADWRAVHMVNGVAGTVYNIHGVIADKDSGIEYLTLQVSQGQNAG